MKITKAKKPIEKFTEWANENMLTIVKKSGNPIFGPVFNDPKEQGKSSLICMGIADGELYLSPTKDKDWAWNKGTINGVTFWFGTHQG